MLIECDVTSDESIRRAFGTIEARVGKIDGLVHAIAYSKKKSLVGMLQISLAMVMPLLKIFQLTACLLLLKQQNHCLRKGSGIVTLTYMVQFAAILTTMLWELLKQLLNL